MSVVCWFCFCFVCCFQSIQCLASNASILTEVSMCTVCVSPFCPIRSINRACQDLGRLDDATVDAVEARQELDFRIGMPNMFM